MAHLIYSYEGFSQNLAFYGSNSASAQYFQVPAGYTYLAYAQIYNKRVGSPGGSYNVGIFSDSGGYPGSALTWAYTNANDVGTSNDWRTYDFGDVAVTPGAWYHLYTTPVGSSLSSTIFWGAGTGGANLKYKSYSTWHTNYTSGSTYKNWTCRIYGYGVPASLGSTTTSSVGETSLTASSSVGSDMGATITERGFCYSTTDTTPDTGDSKKTSGSGTGSFSASITGLAAGTTYYIRSYAINAAGTTYGAVKTQATAKNAPSVTTGAVSNIAITTATVAGNVTDAHGATVTTRGICYNTTGTPTTSDDKVASGSGTGAFSSNLTSLLPDTLYYARAYATNSEGTSYGSQTSFTTLQGTPEVTTGSTSSLTKNSVTCAGEVVDDNGSTVTEAGIVYSINENPTTSNNKVTTSSGEGVFSEDLTGLTPATQYHYRAYAINSEGTEYGDDETFTTLPAGPEDLAIVITGKTSTSLSWTKGSGADTTIVRRATGGYPATYADGTGVYDGAGSSTTDSGLSAGTTYYYRAWSLDGASNYSSEYSSDSDTTDYSLTNPGNTTAEDGSYASGPANDNQLYIRLSKDSGSTWSDPVAITLTGSNAEHTFGNGETELWGDSWTGDDVDDTSFRLLIVCGSNQTTYQIYKDFGFSITSTQILTGIEVVVKAYFDTDTTYIDYIGVNCLYGDSILPITEGTQAYVIDEDCMAYFDGSNWVLLRGGISDTVEILDGDGITTHTMVFEDGVLTSYSTS